MSFIVTASGGKHDVNIEHTIYAEARDANMSVAHYVNNKFKDAEPDLKIGTPFQQICASVGLSLVGQDNPFGLRNATVSDILEGKAGFQAAETNTAGRSTPFGNESRFLFPAAVIQLIEDAIQPDRVTDTKVFDQMVATRISVGTDTFAQPVVSYAGAGSANNSQNGVRAQRITQLSGTPMMLRLTTSDRFRTLPTYGIGMELSDQAMKSTTLDLLALTLNRFILIERDARIYTYLSNLWLGDSDHNTGAVTAVTSSSLDPVATGGVMSHKAWVKFLARNRKKRKITHVVANLDTYLKVEGRVGRPGTTAYDPRLAVVDPQAVMINDTFGGDVKWFLVDDAANGGPVPDGEVWALDAAQAIMMVTNVSADYTATERFVLRRSSAIALHWSEEAFRLYADNDLTPFDRLQIA
jgi:hypothetical protein